MFAMAGTSRRTASQSENSPSQLQSRSFGSAALWAVWPRLRQLPRELELLRALALLLLHESRCGRNYGKGSGSAAGCLARTALLQLLEEHAAAVGGTREEDDAGF